jgi:hypothetical protein
LIADDVVDMIMHTNISRPHVSRFHHRDLQLDRERREICAREAKQQSHEKLDPTIRDAYHKAMDTAMTVDAFFIEHAVLSTIVAFGVLVLISLWVLTALKFGELGPNEGMQSNVKK